MYSVKAVITTAGKAMIAAATQGSKIKITKVAIGSAVATPVIGAEYAISESATTIANVKYNAQGTSLFVCTGLNKKLIAVKATVPKGTVGFWAAQMGVYSDATLIAVLIVPAVYVDASASEQVLKGMFEADLNKFVLNIGPYSKIVSKTKQEELVSQLTTVLTNRLPTATEGSTYFGASADSNESKKLVAIAPIAQSTMEAEVEKTRGSNSDIFNNWQRFSHNATWTQPAVASELQAWEYDSAADAIRCTLNTTTYVGFVSQKKYDKYEIDVNLSAVGDSDDDDIGVVLAFYVDPADGKQHTLSVVRSPGGMGFSFAVIKDYKLPGAEFIHRSTKIAYGNGAYGATAADAGFTANTAGMTWKALGPTRLKATRNGTKFTVISSEFGANWQNFKQDSLFSFDLLDYPSLQMFAVKCPYGFSAHSQFSATYYTRSFVDEGSTIVDIESLKTWQKLNGVWTATSYANKAAFCQALGVGRMFHNPVTGKTFFIYPDDVRRIF